MTSSELRTQNDTVAPPQARANAERLRSSPKRPDRRQLNFSDYLQAS